MPKQCYIPKMFRGESRAIIYHANEIVGIYQRQGLRLTLRQLYYQFVSRACIVNSQSSYKRLGGIINDARLAGLLDWQAIEDRTRNLRCNSHWDSPADIIKSAAHGYALDKWADQTTRVECWIEKDALIGVISDVCSDLDVSFFSCRGYVSQSEMWEAAQRLIRYARLGQSSVILHMGDHDPSGVDMTRDISERLGLFMSFEGVAPVLVQRIALNIDQIARYRPPSNPAKITDTRAKNYIKQWGNESWELDALEPVVLVNLVRDHVGAHMEKAKWEGIMAEENNDKKQLNQVVHHWKDIITYITGKA